MKNSKLHKDMSPEEMTEALEKDPKFAITGFACILLSKSVETDKAIVPDNNGILLPYLKKMWDGGNWLTEENIELLQQAFIELCRDYLQISKEEAFEAATYTFSGGNFIFLLMEDLEPDTLQKILDSGLATVHDSPPPKPSNN